MSLWKRCPLCGSMNLADQRFCITCGQELSTFESPSLLRLLLGHVQEILENLFNPMFAFLKTLWVVTFHPLRFHQALTKGDPPIERIGFPLDFLWKGLFPEVRPYVLDPMEFLLTPIVLGLLLGAASMVESEFSESAEALQVAPLESVLNPITPTEINLITDMTLNFLALNLVLLLLGALMGAAALYRLWLGWKRPPTAKRRATQSAYYFWFYNTGVITMLMLFGRFLPRIRGWDQNPGLLSLWVPVGTALLLAALVWFFGVLPFVLFRSWGTLRVAGAVFSSWLWWGFLYGVWAMGGNEWAAWPAALFMVTLLLLAALPPWMWCLCLAPPSLLGIGALVAWRYRQKRRKRSGPPAGEGPRLPRSRLLR